MRSLSIIIICIMFVGLIFSCSQKKIDFNADVRPILNKNCISCHGGVKQSGGFGLVFRENALGETDNGKVGIVPGKPGKSELIARITHKDPEMRMPLDRQPLKLEEIQTLTKWIEQGAEWEDHWAYLKPEKPAVPENGSEWANNEIDKFVHQKMLDNELEPSPGADKYDLVRRLYLDVVGLPPTLEEVAEFVKDDSEDAYENLVEKLLASPRYGEHWASMWLDLARYADSRGYEKDSERKIWRYRDWVIKAYNDDMPFDQFTVEQLAGDLLPNPSLDQLVATGFHRNTLNNDEGGTDNEEYRIASVIDRVNTTWEVWQSTTMGCVQCHSHPYDPIKQPEYYSSLAFFNNTSDADSPTENPVLKELKEEDQAKLDELKDWIAQVSSKEKANEWEQFVLVSEPKLRQEDYTLFDNVENYNRGDQDFVVVKQNGAIKIPKVDLSDVDRFYLTYRERGNNIGKLTIKDTDKNGAVIGEAELAKSRGFTTVPILIKTEIKNTDLFIKFESESEGYKCEIDGFLIGEKLPADKGDEYTIKYALVDELLNAKPEYTTPIMMEKKPDHSRLTTVFVRGNWLVKGDTTASGIPEMFNGNDKQFGNRLDLAKWFVSEDNTLTSRVMVNRIWSKIFGTGIVATTEDFGTLGDAPTHPLLLDWLASSFSSDWKWSTKSLIRSIVMSSTYRQSSKVTKELAEKDPANKWLARSPRVRLSSEQIRDQALAVSGLLSDKMYGPSVMPLQPDGLWSVVYSNLKWETSDGEDAYRRGLYTFLRRSNPYPSLITFDATNREVCLSRRINTNTPIQALVTLNDPVFIEAARNLAKNITNESASISEKVEMAYERVMGKKPKEDKVKILTDLAEETLAYYKGHPEETKELAMANDPELASYTVVANALLNMDEFIVKN
ncbi:MAG: DUF1553 domain-containing protein [Cyclobacteriaceae bacterium]